jgi:hypothetical protein
VDVAEANGLLHEMFRVPATSKLTKWLAKKAGKSTPDELLYEAWLATDAADLMLSFGNRFADRKTLTQLACMGARLILWLVPAGEERPRLAIETAERWHAGEGSVDEIDAAARGAMAAAGDIRLATPATAEECACEAAAWAAATALGARVKLDEEVEHLTADNAGQAVRVAIARRTFAVWEREHPGVDPEKDPSLRARLDAEKAKVFVPWAAAIRTAINPPMAIQLVSSSRKQSR